MSLMAGISWLIPLSMQIAQLVLGIMALRLCKKAGWMMIAAPPLAIASYAGLLLSRPWLHPSSGPNFFYYVFMIMPSLSQVLFYAGVFMILLQAKAAKKRATEQQMLLDEITKRQ